MTMFETMVATVCPFLIAYPISLLFKSFVQTLKEIQEQLIQSSKMASLGTMGAGIAHEINNPLTIVLGNILFLKKQLNRIDPEPQGLTKKINTINENCNRISKIVSHIKDFSCNTNTSTDNMREIDINKLIKNLSDFFRSLASELKINLIYDLSPSTPKLCADYTSLEQVLLNLVYNAIDAMSDSAEKKLTLKTEKKDDFLHIYITDTGAGIPLEIQPKIFDPFFTTKPPNKGTGLGLSLVNTYMQQNDGKIAFESGDCGTSFNLEFQLSQV